jgi:hypothetical protein
MYLSASLLPPSIRANAQALTIYELFAGKVFRVPKYQRSFAWTETNLEQFWDDVKESLVINREHYWGPITLMATAETIYCKDEDTTFKIYDVVDGQQRITTIYLFLLALSEEGKKPAIRRNFIKTGDVYRVVLGGLNDQFLRDLVDGKNPSPRIGTNERVQNAFIYFGNQIRDFQRFDDLSNHLQNVTFSLEFVVQDKSLAVKAFETLNDRGKQLTLLDKTKSFLMFYSLRYLNNSLDNSIDDVFGNIFTDFDFIKQSGKSNSVNYIRSDGFSEDELLRFFYHYFASYAIRKYGLVSAYDYDISANDVFGDFIKRSCEHLKPDSKKLSDFTKDFLESFAKFVSAFKAITDKIDLDVQIKKLFSFLGINTRVYPLIISLEAEGLLDKKMLDTVESLDLRVYKVRGTDPRADLYNNAISQIRINHDYAKAQKSIIDFAEEFMPEAEFRTFLKGSMYSNEATKYILWEYEKNQDTSFNDSDYAFYKTLQKEHILSPNLWNTLNLLALGFKDSMDFFAFVYTLGNLLLLEEKINKRIGDKVPRSKSSEYQTSAVPSTRKLGYHLSNNDFTKNDIDDRTKLIIDFCVNRWK